MSARIENDRFLVDYDLDRGSATLTHRDDTLVLARTAARALTQPRSRSTSDPDYVRTARVERARDRLGDGDCLVVDCVDAAQEIDFRVRIRLCDHLDAVTFETSCHNRSSHDLVIESLEPVSALPASGGGFCWSGARAALTNGYSFQDPGQVTQVNPLQPRPLASRWNLALSRERDPGGLVLGFLDHQLAEGRIALVPDEDALPLPGREPAAALTMRSALNRGFVLRPGATVESGRAVLLLAQRDHLALEAYADLLASLSPLSLKPPVNGWCHWFYTHEILDEREIVAHAEFVARTLKPYGAEYVQIDGPWSRAYGDWEASAAFPHGMRWLADTIRGFGLQPGLWLAPYLIREGTEVADSHPDWLVRDLDGEPIVCISDAAGLGGAEGFHVPSFDAKTYGLDVTHPGAAEWLHALFRKVSREWGYSFLKLDYIDCSLLAAERYADATMTKAAAHRRGMEIIRDAVGADTHLLLCAAAPPAIGLFDSVRIERDYAHMTWDQFVGHSNSSAPAMAKRYYFHGRTWVNDADHIGVELLSSDQAEAAATIVALSGGNTLIDDRLIDLEPERLEILKKILPAYGVAARPVDLFLRDRPELFVLPIETPFAAWTLVAAFNYDERALRHVDVPLDDLGLDPGLDYVAFDFWKQRLHHEIDGRLRVCLQPGSVALLAVHREQSVPQVIGSNRHFTQGAVELADVHWDDEREVLQGVSLGSAGTEHKLVVRIPPPYRWAEPLPDFFHDLGAYSLRMREPGVLRIHVRCGDSGEVRWQVPVRRQAGS